MKITIHAPERKLPGREFDSKRITGVTYEFSGDELPSDGVARDKLIEAYRKRQLAEMDRLETEILTRVREPPVGPSAPQLAGQRMDDRMPATHVPDKAVAGVQEATPTPPPAPAPKPATPTPSATPQEGDYCSNTKLHQGIVKIEKRVADYSFGKYGRKLCLACQPKLSRR